MPIDTSGPGGGAARQVAQAEVEQVNHPAHYGGDTPYECIKVLEQWLTHEEFVGWLKGTVIKYHARAGRKLGEEAAKDFAKAAWYGTYLDNYLKRRAAKISEPHPIAHHSE